MVPPSSGVGRKGMDTSVFTGYADTSTHKGLSWSLEGYLNDYGIAQMGLALYRKTKDERYKEESAYVLTRLYTGSEIGQGYHGNEDNGEQSAWFPFSSLGFYPLVMGSGEYAIGSPLFTRTTVHLENGRELVVKAPKNSATNIYVQGVKVNGQEWKATSLPHDLLARGGVLEFDLGPRPSAWGTDKNAAPVSITRNDKVASPMGDVITGDGDLFDNTSATSATVESMDPPVAKATEALQYTLTSGAANEAPDGWVLQGSSTGPPGRISTGGPARTSPGTGRPGCSRWTGPGHTRSTGW